MIFKPQNHRLWDVWVMHHAGLHYLFYDLVRRNAIEAVALATSADGVHWTDHGPVIEKPSDAPGIGSGFTWKSPRFEEDGRFQCNFSVDQRIRFAESADLSKWTVRSDIEFRKDLRWYAEDGRWDCICTVPRSPQGYHGYWTADPRDGSYGFGFGETDDGVHWRALPPPRVDWGAFSGYEPEYCEVGGIEVAGGKRHAMINFSKDGSRMLSLMADRPEGPFTLSAKNPVLFEGDAHFARFFSSPDGLLVVHHNLAKEEAQNPEPWDTCYLAPMKRAVVDGDGTLRLGYWIGNDALKGVESPVTVSSSRGRAAVLEPGFDAERGFIVEGEMVVGALAGADTELQPPGLFLESGEDRPTALTVLPGGVSCIGTVDPGGSGFRPREPRAVWCGPPEVDRQVPFGPVVRFRLLARRGMLELYLDDLLFHVRSLTKPLTGKIGLLGATGAVRNVRVWRM